MRFRPVLAAASVVLLTACANLPNRWTPLDARAVGQEAGDTIETIPGGYPPGVTSTMISVVRTFDDHGLLAVCGAAVVAGPSDHMATLKSFVVDRNSILKVGEVDDGQLAISSKFMRIYALPVPNGILDAKAVDYSALMGNCVRTEAPWRPSYASNHHLDLRKTILRH